jgi:hypothetical protein
MAAEDEIVFTVNVINLPTPTTVVSLDGRIQYWSIDDVMDDEENSTSLGGFERVGTANHYRSTRTLDGLSTTRAYLLTIYDPSTLWTHRASVQLGAIAPETDVTVTYDATARTWTATGVTLPTHAEVTLKNTDVMGLFYEITEGESTELNSGFLKPQESVTLQVAPGYRGQAPLLLTSSNSNALASESFGGIHSQIDSQRLTQDITEIRTSTADAHSYDIRSLDGYRDQFWTGWSVLGAIITVLLTIVLVLITARIIQDWVNGSSWIPTVNVPKALTSG